MTSYFGTIKRKAIQCLTNGPRRILILCLIGLGSIPAAAQTQFNNEVMLVGGEVPENSWYGRSVAVDGDIALVGAPRTEVSGKLHGAVYIYQRVAPGDQWQEVKRISAHDAYWFGNAVAISGDYAVVGATGNYAYAGNAYIYARNAGGANNWGVIKKLMASDAQAHDYFGRSVGISDDIVVVGANGSDDHGSYSGSAYIFHRHAGGTNQWGEVQKLIAGDAEEKDYFGRSVSICGEFVVVGAPGLISDDPGSAYLFSRHQGGVDSWGEVKKLTASDTKAGSQFGEAVSLSGDHALIGANGDDENGARSGAAYVYARNAGGAENWGEVKKLLASDGDHYDGFGASLAISDEVAIIGATKYATIDFFERGSAYIFACHEGGVNHWGEVKRIQSCDGFSGDQFGLSVNLGGGAAIVGTSDFFSSATAYLYNQPEGAHLQSLPHIPRLIELINEPSVTEILSLNSVGTQDLVIDSIAYPSGPFDFLETPDLPAILPPGESLEIELRYTPVDAGPLDAEVSVISNDSNDPTWIIPLEGIGLNAANPGVGYVSTFGEPGFPDLILSVDISSGAGTQLGEVHDSEGLMCIAVDSEGSIYTADFNHLILYRIDGSTGDAFKICHLTRPWISMAFDENDQLYAFERYVTFEEKIVSTRFYRVDTSTGQAIQIAKIDKEFGSLAFDPSEGTLYASTLGIYPTEIYTVDKITGAYQLKGLADLSHSIYDIAFDGNGNLHGLGHFSSEYILYSIDKHSCQVSVVGPIGFEGPHGLAIAPSAPLMADRYTLSTSAGGKTNFRLDAGPDREGRPYLLLGTASGIGPGTLLPGGQATLPVNLDAFSYLTLARLNTPLFANFFGVLNRLGQGSAQMLIRTVPIWLGKQLHFAYCLGDPFDFASNAIRVEIGP